MTKNRQSKQHSPDRTQKNASGFSALAFFNKLLPLLSLMLVGTIACLLLLPSSGIDENASSSSVPQQSVSPTPAPTNTPAPPQSAIPTEVLYPTPSFKPTPATYASIGVIGDIMVMQSQIDYARRIGNGGYDFSRSFLPLTELFDSVDLMCGNLETTFFGSKLTYYDIVRNDGTIRVGCRFSAPDELAENLRQAGFDVITTANNHTCDTGWEGLKRTVEVVRAAGLLQTGTFLSTEDRSIPLVTEVNGIKIGIIACAGGVNGQSPKLSAAQQEYAFSSFRRFSELDADIERTKDAGAEFIIAFVHWGVEFTHSPSASQTSTAKKLAEAGVDAIFGAHPHFVQPIEWLTVQRNGQEVTIPVIYSLGNFISNMAPTPRDYGMFVKLGLKKQGSYVSIADMAYLPLYCIKQRTSDGVLHQVLPCYEDAASASAWEPLTEANHNKLRHCREYVANIIGEETARLMASVER